MLAVCETANIVVSSLIFVLGRVYITPMPSHVREAVIEFAVGPTDAGLQGLMPLLQGHRLSEQIRGVFRDVELFGGLEAVLAAADEQHAANFQAAMKAMKGDENA